MKILIVVDMQNDFITGALGTPEAQVIVPAVNEKIREYESRNDAIIYTRDTHYDDYLTTDEGKHLPVVHCVEFTDGWQIADEVVYIEDASVINKKTFGCYSLPEVIMECYGYDTDGHPVDIESIELIGLCTDICVISNALILKSFCTSNEWAIPIKVDAKCCAGVTPATHKAALDVMKMCQIEVED